MSGFTLHAGPLEEVLPEHYTDNTFDSCVTDPPYGLGFMGKEWDTFKIEQRSRSRKNSERKNGSTGSDGRSFTAGEYDTSPKGNQLFQQWFEDKARHIYRVLKPGGYFVTFCAPRTAHRMWCAVEDAGFEIRDTMMWVFASGFPKSHNLEGQFEGWGSALKPAYEPILIARKPFIGTIAKNMAVWGTGAINIKDCRIEGEPWVFGTQTDIRGGKYGDSRPADGQVFARNVHGGELGRWPSTLIHDGSDEVRALFPNSTGQLAPVSTDAPTRNGFSGPVSYSGFLARKESPAPRIDQDKSAARFFYCPKTSRKDRNEGCENLPDVKGGMVSNTSGQHITRRDVLYKPRATKNGHPTVKPTELMRYLCRLVTVPGGKILDPFAGSGSTLKAAALEGFSGVGIDKDGQWIPVADARINFAVRRHQSELIKKAQVKMFS